MNRVEREKIVIERMIAIYCKKHHRLQDVDSRCEAICSDCQQLLEYAHQRLERCPKGDWKTSCRKCEIHCYAPHHREAVRCVMRYVGPRMLFIHPLMALRHLLAELR